MDPSLPSSTPCEQEFARNASGQPLFAVRAAQPKDLFCLAEILAESFHPRTGLMHWVYPILRMGIYEDLRSRLRSTSPHYICLVALDRTIPEGTEVQSYSACNYLVGTLEMALRSPNPWQARSSQYLYLSNLAVRPPRRRQGIAQQLLLACEQTALRWGFQDLYLHVLENNHQARQLYFKAGYQLQQIEPTWSYWLFRQPRRLLLHKHLTNPSQA